MNGTVCAVVGIGPGIGLSVAKLFGGSGFRVAMLARRQASLDEMAHELGEAGVQARGFVADAGDATGLRDALDEVARTMGSPEVLVYNAAALKQAPPSALSPDDMIADFKINVVGAAVAAQAVLPAMRAKRSGTILFTGGGLALDPYPAFASLAIGKAGIRSLALSLAKEVEPDGIHVATVTVCGFVRPGTRFDPELIAREYLRLHRQSPGSFEHEHVFK